MIAWTNRNASGSRKFSRLNNSRRLLLSGVPVNKTRWTVLSCFSRLKIRLLSDLTDLVSFDGVTVNYKKLTSLALIHAEHLPSRYASKSPELRAGDHVVSRQDHMSEHLST